MFALQADMQIDFFILKSDSHLLKKVFHLLQWNPFKNDEKCFLFHLKNFLRSLIFNFLRWISGHVEKTAWLERQD